MIGNCAYLVRPSHLSDFRQCREEAKVLPSDRVVLHDFFGVARHLRYPDHARRACSHYPSPSTISAKLIKARNITSSFSNREKMRRKPLRRRNRRPTSFLRLYIFRSFSHGSRRFLLGGTTGMKPRSSASCRVSSPFETIGTASKTKAASVLVGSRCDSVRCRSMRRLARSASSCL